MRQNAATGQEDFLLGVEKSVTGRAWKTRPVEFRVVQAIAQAQGVPEIVARVVAGRGIVLKRQKPS